jgi:hypothetical protein
LKIGRPAIRLAIGHGDGHLLGVLMFVKVSVALCGASAFLLASAAMAQTSPAQMHLICRGVGDHKVELGSEGTAFGRHGSVSAFGSSQSQSQFEDEMDIEIDGAAGKARVPRRFLPRFHGGDGGWFDLKDLVVGDDTITGSVLINYANHPKLRIDRRSGSVALDGKVGAFAGQCQAYDPAAAKRAF